MLIVHDQLMCNVLLFGSNCICVSLNYFSFFCISLKWQLSYQSGESVMYFLCLFICISDSKNYKWWFCMSHLLKRCLIDIHVIYIIYYSHTGT